MECQSFSHEEREIFPLPDLHFLAFFFLAISLRFCLSFSRAFEHLKHFRYYLFCVSGSKWEKSHPNDPRLGGVLLYIINEAHPRLFRLLQQNVINGGVYKQKMFISHSPRTWEVHIKALADLVSGEGSLLTVTPPYFFIWRKGPTSSFGSCYDLEMIWVLS